MFDFPSFRPTIGDHKRFNEQFCKGIWSKASGTTVELTVTKDHRVANTLIDEFPCRPHWTKNTREVFTRSVKNLDPNVGVLTRPIGVV